MDKAKSLILRIAARILALPIVVWLLILLPAGTLDFWQVYAYFGVILCMMFAVTPWFLRNSPQLLEERLKTSEPEPTQRVVMAVMTLGIFALYLTVGFDKRFGWSSISTSMILSALLVVACGYAFMVYVMMVNSHSSRTVKVDEGQQLIDNGPYAVIRHPMYAGAVLMFLATPIALASWWAMLPAFLTVALLVPRIFNEESVLRSELRGYPEYTERVRWRLVPGIW